MARKSLPSMFKEIIGTFDVLGDDLTQFLERELVVGV